MYRALWLTLVISQQWSAHAGFLKKVQPLAGETTGLVKKTTDWSGGENAWKEAMDAHVVENHLWTQPNYCDARVLQSSAPFTLLFGLSTFWEDVRKHRDSLGKGSDQPLEIHIPGSAYPFEGRSDWSLLAGRKPADISKVRVVLVLGTPWHEDNVPVMREAKEYNEEAGPEMQAAKKLQKGMDMGEFEMEDSFEDEREDSFEDFLQIRSSKAHNHTKQEPEVGTVNGGWGELKCKSNSKITDLDKKWNKHDFCRDHGNGVEVVCVEKFYQDARDDLPKPDLVVMFSPGYPQLGRRSWDQVLRPLLESNVPIMANDIVNQADTVFTDTAGRKFNFYDTTGKILPKPGKKWEITTKTGEGGLSLTAMRGYEANEVGGWRNPFPIYINGQDGDTAKPLIVQLFKGRKANAKPFEVYNPATSSLKRLIDDVDWVSIGTMDPDFAAEVKMSFLFPCSTAFDKGMWNLYKDPVKKRLARFSERHHIRRSWEPMLKKLGLTDDRRSPPRETPWTVPEWLFIITKLKFAEF